MTDADLLAAVRRGRIRSGLPATSTGPAALGLTFGDVPTWTTPDVARLEDERLRHVVEAAHARGVVEAQTAEAVGHVVERVMARMRRRSKASWRQCEVIECGTAHQTASDPDNTYAVV